MPAKKGNKYWEMRSSHGRKPIYDSPEKLWNEACEYFQWVEDNPLYETKLFPYQGEITQGKVPKMRAMSINGLCIYLDIDYQTFLNYEQNKDDGFFDICTRIRGIIKAQKFEGAAAELLNPAIIARDLGLTDKQNVKHSGDVSSKITITVLENDSPPLADDETKID